ncbi:hypothetical protein [Peribacillus simplex]|uniref:hypothetical protein n=1 Tax=Peribacillus simplex TaxID=1478 RepID=UPI003D2652B8
MKKDIFSFTAAIVGIMAPLFYLLQSKRNIFLISSLSLYGASIVCTIIALKRKEKNRIKYFPFVTLIPIALYQLLIIFAYKLLEFINGLIF